MNQRGAPRTTMIRRRRAQAVEVFIEPVRPARTYGGGVLRTLSGFAVVVALGTGLLALPIASEGGRETSLLEALFTAVSAICVTGHVVVDTPVHWSRFGEVVILVLIQVGGLGYMLGATVILWAFGRQLGVRDRQMLRLYYGAPSLGETLGFARAIGLYTLVVESLGAAVLFAAFVHHGEPPGQALYWGVFHSISAFNNAGFSITGSDLYQFRTSEVVLGSVSLLVVLGGLGVVPALAFSRQRSWSRLPLDTKLVLLTTGALLLFGTLCAVVFEWNNAATAGAVAPAERPVLGFFQSAMTRTAGFSAIDYGAATDATKFSTIPLMFIGGGAGSTAGGIKVGVFALLGVAMFATFRGREEAVILNRRIPERVIRQALVLALGAVGAVIAFTLAITVASPAEEFLNVLFDTVSALGTVGLSTGAVARGGADAHLLYIAAMLVGRFGPLVLVLHMTRQRRRSTYRAPEDSIRLG